MCLIAVGHMPPQDILEEAADSNPHGIGIAWPGKKRVEYRKKLSVKDLLEMPDWIKKDCAVHFRLATVGGRGDELIHPFPIEPQVRLTDEGSASRVLFHNGHVHSWETYLKQIHPLAEKGLDGPVSDSRAIAWLVFKMGPNVLHFMSGSRFLVMSRQKNLFFGEWYNSDDKATLYSNASFRYKRAKGKSSGIVYGEFGQDYTYQSPYRSGYYDSQKHRWIAYEDKEWTWRDANAYREQLDKDCDKWKKEWNDWDAAEKKAEKEDQKQLAFREVEYGWYMGEDKRIVRYDLTATIEHIRSYEADVLDDEGKAELIEELREESEHYRKEAKKIIESRVKKGEGGSPGGHEIVTRKGALEDLELVTKRVVDRLKEGWNLMRGDAITE